MLNFNFLLFCVFIISMDYSFQELLDLAVMFRDAEVLLEKTISLLSKFPDQYQLVENLLLYSDSVIRTEEEQDSIWKLFDFGKFFFFFLLKR